MNSRIRVRLLCLILCLTVFVPCVPALGETTKVATYLLRLREKPSYTAEVLDAFPRGTRVVILKKGLEWTKVKAGGKTGYMKTEKLAYAKYKTAAEREIITGAKKASSTAIGDTAYVKKGVCLNLRDSAGDGEIIASFHGGTKVTILKKGRHWSYVSVRGLTGYMSNDYLTAEKE